MEIKVGVNIIRQVTAPDYDWTVLYFKNVKIWEGDTWDCGSIEAVAKALGAKYESHEFTDWEEIDGETPDSFMHIRGIKEL
jgi:hypothetical protein